MSFLPRFVLSLFLAAVVAVGAGVAAEPGPRLAKGLLWKIDGGPISARTAPNYLLGTVHLADRRVTKLAAPIRNAFDRARVYVGELELGPQSDQVIAMALMAAPGQPALEKLIGARRMQVLARELPKRGIPAQLAPSFKPWALAVMLSMPKQDPKQVLDSLLQSRAVKRGIALSPLETAAEQMAAFNAMPMRVQAKLLAETLDTIRQLPAQLRALIGAYLTRDLNKIDAVARDLMDESSPDVARHFEVELGIKRNYRMVERMIPKLKKGGAFIAVGALHLPGAEGIITLLRKRGYRVSAVY